MTINIKDAVEGSLQYVIGTVSDKLRKQSVNDASPDTDDFFRANGDGTSRGVPQATIGNVLDADTENPLVSVSLTALTVPYAVTSSAGALAIDWDDGHGLFRTLATSQNITSFSFTNLPTFALARLLVVGGGSHTITFPTGYAIFPYQTTLVLTSAKRRLLSFQYNGTTKEIFISGEGEIIP